jgi:agarase
LAVVLQKDEGVALSAAMSGQSGYFAVAERDGILWLIDPTGRHFLSKGVNAVRFDQEHIQGSDRIPYAEACTRKYGGRNAWRAAAAARLARWGFNTLGSWSDETVASAGPSPFAVAPNLDLGMSFAWRENEQSMVGYRQEFPDVFDQNFDRHIRRRAKELCGPRRDEQQVLGWFVDNELRWCPDWRGAEELLGLFLGLSPASAGRKAALDWLKERHRDFTIFNASWQTPICSWDGLAALAHIDAPYRRDPPYQRRAADEEAANRADPRRARFAADCDDFDAHVAERYFALTSAAIKAADPHHLVLGARFAYPPPRGVIDAAGHHCDIVSFNCYDLDPGAAIDSYAAAGKPCLIGEFSFRAVDSGLPNTNGAGPLVATQAERAACFRRYVAAALRRRAVVGYHWFEHADQPAQGRFDGENSNFGTVTIEDDVYQELTQAMTAVNAEAEALHEASALAA